MFEACVLLLRESLSVVMCSCLEKTIFFHPRQVILSRLKCTGREEKNRMRSVGNNALNVVTSRRDTGVNIGVVSVVSTPTRSVRYVVAYLL